MKRIILHWSAGTYTPNSCDREHYHFLIDGEGNIHSGKYKPEDNLDCNDGCYAAHTGGGNTGSIGISLCGMLGYKNPLWQGKYPLMQIQFERAYKLCADLCRKYALVISPITVLTHYEFGKQNPKTTSAGKIDINFIPYMPSIGAQAVGDYIRGKVRWYYSA